MVKSLPELGQPLMIVAMKPLLLKTITILDSTMPELTEIPDDITVECDEIPEAPEVIVTDNCDTNVELHFEKIK